MNILPIIDFSISREPLYISPIDVESIKYHVSQQPKYLKNLSQICAWYTQVFYQLKKKSKKQTNVNECVSLWAMLMAIMSAILVIFLGGFLWVLFFELSWAELNTIIAFPSSCAIFSKFHVFLFFYLFVRWFYWTLFDQLKYHSTQILSNLI